LDWEKSNRKIKSQAFERYWSQRELGLHFERNGRFAVIEIQTFTQGVALNFAQALPKMLKRADGVVLDLRANGGGDAHAMADMASVFLGDGINLGRFADRSGVSFDLQTNSKMVWSAKSFVQTKLPLVVLTSENTSSSAEILAAALQTTRRARVIGTETCGCVLAIRNRHTLPDGGILDVSELDYLTPEGFRLEGTGVKPDETIKLMRSDIYSRHDRAIEAAKTFLKSIKRK
jgi:carboxyl-terminal processing protease